MAIDVVGYVRIDDELHGAFKSALPKSSRVRQALAMDRYAGIEVVVVSFQENKYAWRSFLGRKMISYEYVEKSWQDLPILAEKFADRIPNSEAMIADFAAGLDKITAALEFFGSLEVIKTGKDLDDPRKNVD